MKKRNYRAQLQRSLVFSGIEDTTLNRALLVEFTDEQHEIYQKNMEMKRSQLVQLLNIDRLTFNFIVERMRTRVNHRPDRPNPFADKVIELLKAGVKQQNIIDRLDVSQSLVTYYNKKLKKEREELHVINSNR